MNLVCKITKEATACTKKYFNLDSLAVGDESIIRGIKESRLISNPSQALNQDFLTNIK